MDLRERQQTETDIDKAVSSGCAKFEIPAGLSVDNRCVDEIIRIFDAAERFDKNVPMQKNETALLIKKYKKVLGRFRSKNLKKIYEKELSRLISMLS